MKKICMILVMFTIVISLSAGCAKEPEADTGQNEPVVSEKLDYEGLVQYYAEKHEVSVGDAVKAIDDMGILEENLDAAETARYRVLTIPLPVDCEYKPKVELYAEIAGKDDDWTISKIKGTAFVGEVNDRFWQFAGNVKFWLREDRQIEYDVNGDFGQNGKGEAYMDAVIEKDGSEGAFVYKMSEHAGDLKNKAYCSQHEWVTYLE